MHEDQPERPRPAPLEITIRVDPTAAKDTMQAAGQQMRAAGNAVSAWLSAHSRSLSVALSIAIAGLVVWLIGGAVRAIAVIVASTLVYGAIRLKARYSPLLR